jgi:hypothetical protein
MPFLLANRVTQNCFKVMLAGLGPSLRWDDE